jgi:DNA replication protein DnaC
MTEWANVATLGGNRNDPRYADLTEDDYWFIAPSNGERLEMPPILALQRKRQIEQHIRIRATYGIAEYVACPFCEDSGRHIKREDERDMLDLAGQPCFCDSGQRASEHMRRSASWAHMIPERFRSYTLDSSPNIGLVTKFYDWMTADPLRTGQGVVILGRPGGAKTGTAIGMLRYFHEQGISVMYANTQELIDSVKEGFDRKQEDATNQKAKAERVKVLLLDDLGSEHITEWGVTMVNQLIRKRYDEMRPTIITSNLDSAQFDRQMNERIISRLRECSRFIAIDGQDYRTAGR